MLDVIRAPEGGTLGIHNPPQVAYCKSARHWKENQQLNASEPNQTQEASVVAYQ